jgi:hypothetical protein
MEVQLERFDGNNVQMKLGGIIYFGNSHFTARILDLNGGIYYNDGLQTGNQCIYEGKYHSFSPVALWENTWEDYLYYILL